MFGIMYGLIALFALTSCLSFIRRRKVLKKFEEFETWKPSETTTYREIEEMFEHWHVYLGNTVAPVISEKRISCAYAHAILLEEEFCSKQIDLGIRQDLYIHRLKTLADNSSALKAKMIRSHLKSLIESGLRHTERGAIEVVSGAFKAFKKQVSEAESSFNVASANGGAMPTQAKLFLSEVRALADEVETEWSQAGIIKIDQPADKEGSGDPIDQGAKKEPHDLDPNG